MSAIDELHHFNELTAGEDERLALLLEEMGETLQIIGKIQRHGLDSYHPDRPDVSNRQLLEKELGDVRYAITLLCVAEDVNRLAIMEAGMRKAAKVGQYMHHQSATLLAAAKKEYSR